MSTTRTASTPRVEAATALRILTCNNKNERSESDDHPMPGFLLLARGLSFGLRWVTW